MALNNTQPFSQGAVRIDPARQGQPNRPQQPGGGKPDFQELLRRASQEQQGVTLSRHVRDRLEQRDITISEQQAAWLDSAVKLAGEKGIRDTLVLTPDAAFIVNVPSRTVVTAMERQAAAERVFTNIDGAVVFSG